MEGYVTRPGRRASAWATTGLLAMLGLLAAAPAASAGPLIDALGGTCPPQAASQAFANWGDPFQYVLLPDGSFSSGGSGWDLDGAQIVEENETSNVSGADTQASARIAAGSVVTSPPVCVSLVYPTLRFFAKNVGSPLGTLRVDVLFEAASGVVVVAPIGVVTDLGRGWKPTLPMTVLANLIALLPDDQTPVEFRFTPQGAGSAWQIDDVYVDPYCKR